MQWAGPTDGVSDCTPYLNSVMANLPAGDTVLDMPSGIFCFNTPLNPLPRMWLRGQGKLSTILKKQFNGGVMFTLTGQQGDGTQITDMAIECSTAYTPGLFAYLGCSDSVHQPDETQFRRLWVSSLNGGLWAGVVEIDGISRTSPQGVRDVVFEDCEFFNSQSWTIWARNVVGFTMRGGGCFPGAGPVNGCGIYVTGGGAPLTNSVEVSFQGVNNNGVLNITNSSYGYYSGNLGSLATDGSSHWRIDASCSGAIYNGLTNSLVQLW